MDINEVLSGVIIGAVGGACAGFAVSFVSYMYLKIVECRDKKHVFQWLVNNTKDVSGQRYRSTRAIASWNNITEDRVRYICSIHEKIFLSTGDKEDLWGIVDRRGADN